MGERARLPLNALRTFEACARLGSFLKAAEELSVTPGAVSRQVKALEAELGVRLFDRFNRAVRLTEVGERLAQGVGEGLTQLEAAVHRVRPAADGPLVVSVLHSFAAKWLAPRLAQFEVEHPDTPVLVSASDRAVDLAREGVDVAIRYGVGPYPGLDAQLLMSGRVGPVCSPRLLEGPNALRTPQDLARAVLIHDITYLAEEPQWSSWLAANGVTGADLTRGPSFSNSYMAIDAAVAGRGVALIQLALVSDDLAAGRLVQVFDSVESPFKHWAICLPERADAAKIRRFRRWLLAQAKATEVAAVE